jgi:hypothetical protein
VRPSLAPATVARDAVDGLLPVDGDVHVGGEIGRRARTHDRAVDEPVDRRRSVGGGAQRDPRDPRAIGHEVVAGRARALRGLDHRDVERGRRWRVGRPTLLDPVDHAHAPAADEHRQERLLPGHRAGL